MLETNLAKPFLVVYIIWHPDFAAGAGLAEILRGHFRRELYQNVAGGTGLSVIFVLSLYLKREAAADQFFRIRDHRSPHTCRIMYGK